MTISENSLLDPDKRKEMIEIVIKLLENAETIAISSDLHFRDTKCDYTIHIYNAPSSLLETDNQTSKEMTPDEQKLFRTFGASLGYILANAESDEQGVEMVKELRNYLKEKQEELKNGETNNIR